VFIGIQEVGIGFAKNTKPVCPLTIKDSSSAGNVFMTYLYSENEQLFSTLLTEENKVVCVALTRRVVSLTCYLVWTHIINKYDVTMGVGSLATKE
jgi:hypothetical protein